MTNIISFNKTKTKSADTINLNSIRSALAVALNDPIAKQARMLFRPQYLDQRTAAMFKTVDLSIDSFLNVILLTLINTPKDELFTNDKLIELFEKTNLDILANKPTIFTLNFEDEIFSISLIPLNGVWVLVDAFTGSESLLQDSIDDACESMGMHREELSIV